MSIVTEIETNSEGSLAKDVRCLSWRAFFRKVAQQTMFEQVIWAIDGEKESVYRREPCRCELILVDTDEFFEKVLKRFDFEAWLTRDEYKEFMRTWFKHASVCEKVAING